MRKFIWSIQLVCKWNKAVWTATGFAVRSCP